MQLHLRMVSKIVKREFWIEKIEEAWQRRLIVWLREVYPARKTKSTNKRVKIAFFMFDFLLEEPGINLLSVTIQRTQNLDRM